MDLSSEPISVTDRCRRAIEKIEHAKKLHPRELETEIDEVQCELVGLRDHLIDHLRRTEKSPVSGQRHPGLEKINIALSLILTVEYPVTAIQRSALDQAREALAQALSRKELEQDEV